MPLIKPFPGLRPARERAEDVIAPPYDVLSKAEAQQKVQGRPWSFLHVSRAEIDLPDDTDPYAPEVYAKAAVMLDSLRGSGILASDPQPCYYVYRIWVDTHVQTGLVAVASVDAYNSGRIKKHEFTRPAKEDDRVRQIDALNAQTGPVLLAYEANKTVDHILATAAESPPDVNVTAEGNVMHQLWLISDPAVCDTLTRTFDAMPALYVADGHHRSAAAARVAAKRMAANPDHTGEEPYNYFLSVMFPHSEMLIFDYNRVVRDLNGLSQQAFLEKLEAAFTITPSPHPYRPACSGEFGMYLKGRWYRLALHPDRMQSDDSVARLDSSLLTRNLLDPILGIKDLRRDERIDFVGGIRGRAGLEAPVNSGEMAVAFAVFPVTMDDLMAVADAGEVMPPKSTWFEPKLVDGLVSHLLD
ncbi:hypothetical protein MNBD_GAMMA26-2420 [hydrothermal vent metagenome]|uniref:HTH domain of SpoOJ/ParA/ParB/repB family, involved in chromosome partitioning n=1 Tax=hydrothermal vent metagenome TaxID=652676 RepID=A0A3B1AXB1_9ZZZZ